MAPIQGKKEIGEGISIEEISIEVSETVGRNKIRYTKYGPDAIRQVADQAERFDLAYKDKLCDLLWRYNIFSDEPG